MASTGSSSQSQLEPMSEVRTVEANEQSKRIRIAAGAATLGGVTCFMLPVVGGITLACAGAAAAAAMTTRADEAGEAARASGAAVAVGFEKVSKLSKARALTLTTKTTDEPEKKKNDEGWWSRTLASFRPSAPRLERYGEARSAGAAAELIVRELVDAPRDNRRRLCNEIIASLHPDRTYSVAAKASATALTRVALAVRDFFDDQGWDVLDRKGCNAVIADVKKRVDRL